MKDLVTVNATEITAISFNAEYFNSYISFLDASKKTVETYSKALKQFWQYLSINGITAPQRTDILAYKDDLKATGHKPTTIQNYITAIKLFFSWTEQEGLYPNIADHIKGAKLDRDHKKDYLTASQVKAVLNTVDTSSEQGLRDYAILLLMITGGLRTIEVERANIADLRTAGGNTVLYVQGKGHEEKTDYVIIAEPIERAIRAYLSTRGKVGETSPLFASTSNNNRGQRMTTRSISAIAKNAMIKAGYDSSRLTAHSLRHTAVTLALLSGMPLEEVQQFARHSNIATTMIYNHSLEKSKNGCSNAIASAIF